MIQVLSEIVGRMRRVFQAGGSVPAVLGYPHEISFSDYLAMYKRGGVGRAIIDRPAKATWAGPLFLLEMGEARGTPFEAAWETLATSLRIKRVFSQLDRLSGIGGYGALLLGFSDAQNFQQLRGPVRPGASLKLLYVRPLSEGTCGILKYETDGRSPRYGEPALYSVAMGGDRAGQSAEVHHSRILHVVEDGLESTVHGSPRLEAVYNRLLDLEKLVGGSAEMFWRGARPGYTLDVDKDFQMTPADEEKLREQLDEYEQDLRRVLVNQGVKLGSIPMQVSDPSGHVDIQLQVISAVTGIPKRILTGSERGELSSAQDQEEWGTYVQARREEFAEPCIVRPFVERLVGLGVLPSPGEGYSVRWSDLFAKGEAERAKTGETRARALKEYASQPAAEAIMVPQAFYRFCLGLTEEELGLLGKMQEQWADGLVDLDAEEEEVE